MMNYNKLAFDFCPAPIVVLSNRYMMEMNVAFANLFGYAREELIEQSIVKIFPSIEDYEKVGDDALQSLMLKKAIFILTIVLCCIKMVSYFGHILMDKHLHQKIHLN